MSKTLKLDTLKNFKPSGVNVDRSVIDNALKEYGDSQEITSKEEDAHKEDLNANDVDKKNQLQVIRDEYEGKIALLEKKVEIAESQDKPLSKNEEKLLNAIRSEKINQAVLEPIIGRNMLIKKYRMNSKYLDDSIKSLEIRKIIKRKEFPYSSKIMTNSWIILEE
jgi:hypothetical protein